MSQTITILTRCGDCTWEGDIRKAVYNRQCDAYFCPCCGSEDLEDYEQEVI